MTNYLFFSGKGGVGKTTMASATGIHHASCGKRTLIVTTDPASNLADVFEQEIGHKIAPIRGVPKLWAMEIDPDVATREYKERIIGPFRDVMPADVIASLEENLSGPCTTEMAAFDRFIEFMEGDEYEIIVFDTAPTGHTVRLLELPLDWSRHIEQAAKGSGQTCLGPVQSIKHTKEKYDRASSLLKDSSRTTFIFVMRPDELSLYETQRASKELETIGIKSGQVIINAILPESACEIEFFRKIYEAQKQVIRRAEETIRKPKRYMLLRDHEVKGIAGLHEVREELYNGKRPEPGAGIDADSMKGDAVEQPDLNDMFLPKRKKDVKVIFFSGKGGVGKTTISCMTALQIAKKDYKTLIITTDPAAHLGEVFGIRVGSEPTKITDKLFAARIDQQQSFEEYRKRILSEARARYSQDMLAAMEEELNSPCTQEMAAFDKFSRFIKEKEYEVVVFDTAPTGHTLRLLALTFHYAEQQDAMASTAKDGANRENANRFREIISLLRDRQRAAFCFVLYPESTPIMEASRAISDLKAAGIEAQLVVANMVLPIEVCGNDFFRNRRKMQMKHLQDIRERINLPVLQFPMMQQEIAGLGLLERAGNGLFPFESKNLP